MTNAEAQLKNAAAAPLIRLTECMNEAPMSASALIPPRPLNVSHHRVSQGSATMESAATASEGRGGGGVTRTLALATATPILY